VNNTPSSSFSKTKVLRPLYQAKKKKKGQASDLIPYKNKIKQMLGLFLGCFFFLYFKIYFEYYFIKYCSIFIFLVRFQHSFF
jgi:hypothetical protein